MRATPIHALGCCDGAVLLVARPDLRELAAVVHAPRTHLSELGVDELLVTLLTAAVWLTSLWLAIGLVAGLASSVPGPAGRIAEALARLVLPRLLQRLLAGSLGLGVLVNPVVASVASPAAGRPGVAVSTVASASPGASPASTPVPAPTWPETPSARSLASTPPPRPSVGPSAPRWPTADRATPPATGSAPTPPEAGASPRRSPASPGSDVASSVRVHAGDSLWMLAAGRLGPNAAAARIMAEWPRWYAANRDVIGADPALLQPGQTLHAPDSSTTPAPLRGTP